LARLEGQIAINMLLQMPLAIARELAFEWLPAATASRFCKAQKKTGSIGLNLSRCGSIA